MTSADRPIPESYSLRRRVADLQKRLAGVEERLAVEKTQRQTAEADLRRLRKLLASTEVVRWETTERTIERALASLHQRIREARAAAGLGQVTEDINTEGAT